MTATTFDVDVLSAGEPCTIVYPDGGEIFAKGEPGCRAFIVRRGTVEIRDGAHVFERLKEGEIFGEMALIDEEPRTATAVAVGRVEVVPIERGVFDALIRDDLDFALAIMRVMARRLRATIDVLSPPEAAAVLGSRA